MTGFVLIETFSIKNFKIVRISHKFIILKLNCTKNKTFRHKH